METSDPHARHISDTECFPLLQPDAKQRTHTHTEVLHSKLCTYSHDFDRLTSSCYHICTSAAKPNLDCPFLLHPQCSPGRPLVVGHVRYFWHITRGIFIKTGAVCLIFAIKLTLTAGCHNGCSLWQLPCHNGNFDLSLEVWSLSIPKQIERN